jgi:hypothetical protein
MYTELITMLADKRVSHFASLAKYAVGSFLDVTLLGQPRQLAHQQPDLGVLASVARRLLGELSLPRLLRPELAKFKEPCDSGKG